MQLRRLQTFRQTLTSTNNPDTPLRPCQQVYLGESNARRMLKRAQLSRKTGSGSAGFDDPIFALHEEASESEHLLAAAAVPFEAIDSPASPGSPDRTGYSVQCYATHLEDESRKKEEAATEKEVMVLFNSINISRQVEGASPLKLNSALWHHAQEHAEQLHVEEVCSSPGGTLSSLPAYVPNVTVHTPRAGRRRATLVSPPAIGALACGEMWYGGKYRRHLYAVREAGSGSGSGSSIGSGGSDEGPVHPEDCPCRLRMVFETMVDDGWTCVGIGRGGNGNGRWVVELGE